MNIFHVKRQTNEVRSALCTARTMIASNEDRVSSWNMRSGYVSTPSRITSWIKDIFRKCDRKKRESNNNESRVEIAP